MPHPTLVSDFRSESIPCFAKLGHRLLPAVRFSIPGSHRVGLNSDRPVPGRQAHRLNDGTDSDIIAKHRPEAVVLGSELAAEGEHILSSCPFVDALRVAKDMGPRLNWREGTGIMSCQALTAAQLELLQSLTSGAKRSGETEDLVDLAMLGLVRETGAGWELTEWGRTLLIERDEPPPLKAGPSV